ncbi:MAG: YopX family protein [Peptostreptococcaceae bacterium]
MNNIKFRVYSKSHKLMLDNEMLKNAANGMFTATRVKLLEMGEIKAATQMKRGIYLPIEDKDLTFMQYTGIEDENGNEIYEGDIVTFENHKFTIVFEAGSFMFARVNIDTDMYELFEDCWNDDAYPLSQFWWNHEMDTSLYGVDVIGNIYENPAIVD